MIYKINLISLLIIFQFSVLSCQKKNEKPPLVKSESTGTSFKAEHSDTSVNIEYLMGKFDPKNHPDFVEIPLMYADRAGQYIRKEVLQAFIMMYDAATKDGVKIQIRSATRNFEDQKRIWENKWTGKTLLEDNKNASKDTKDDVSRAKKILEYSSMPGTSRHHWGTDMDFNSFDNAWFDKGEGLKLYRWLKKHAPAFGFCQPYTAIGDERKTGYFEEKWHWTFMPLSAKYTEQAKNNIKNEMITGFKGYETAAAVDMVNNYILGISPACIDY